MKNYPGGLNLSTASLGGSQSLTLEAERLKVHVARLEDKGAKSKNAGTVSKRQNLLKPPKGISSADKLTSVL